MTTEAQKRVPSLRMRQPSLSNLPSRAGGLKGPGRKTGFLVFLAVEPREVLADDLGGCVALETLRARIPTGHDPRRVQHVDGVIRHGLDEEAVASVIR